MDLKQLKTDLLVISDEGLDPVAKKLIEAWLDKPTAFQVLEVLDKCARYSLTSNLVILVLDSAYDDLLRQEGTTHEEVVKLATWRK